MMAQTIGIYSVIQNEIHNILEIMIEKVLQDKREKISQIEKKSDGMKRE